MAGPTTTSQIDQAVERFLAASRYTLQERMGVMRSCMRVERLPENSGPSVNIPKYGTVSTYALTEGVDMTQAQQITDTLMTLTPAEYGAQVVLTDMMMMTVRDSFYEVASRILRDSFDRQQDQTLCDDADNFSLTIGGAATACHVGHIMASEASIAYNGPANGSGGRGGEPGPYPIFAVLTPPMIHALNKSLTGGQGTAAATQITPETERTQKISGDAGKVPGTNVTLKSDINFSKDTSDDAKVPIMSQEAWILVELGAAAGVEKERDASLRAWELNYVGRWARGEYNDNWGREGTFDTALPTS